MSHLAYIDHIQYKGYLKAIQSGLEYIEFGKMVSSSSKIFIKPNLTFPEYKPGVMTNPDSIRAAVEVISDYTPHITIGDSDSGGYNRFSMNQVYEKTGIIEFQKKYNVNVVNLSQLPRNPIHFSYKHKDFKLDLPVLLLEEIDLLVTMPVPKVHANTKVSLTFKNQWGCIPENKDRLRLHPYFKHVILEVNRAIKSKVAIVDGLYGLTENGPMSGKPVCMNWIMVANSLGVGARLCCEIMGIPLSSVPHLRYAEKMGWIPSPGEISTNQNLDEFIQKEFKLRRKLTDYPGLIAFNNPLVAYLAYFSPLAGFLHKLLYLVRKPFYDYGK